ncbi:MAG: PHP domain-containing protein [Actinomycetota bacterium]
MTDGFPFDVGGVWLKAALHTHTSRSDGDLEPEAHVRHHEWMGFDVCAITDHWTLTHVPSTEHILVITGAELAADPGPGMDNDVEILAIGLSDIPQDPGGDRSRWGPIDAYHYKTFPDLSAAAANINEQGGVPFIAHPYWSGMPHEVILATEGAVGLEVWNASSERENGRGDSSYVWDLALERGKQLWGFGTDDCHHAEFDIGDAWTMVRAADRSEEAFLEALRRGHTYASNGPQILRVERDREALEVRCTPARMINLISHREHGWSVRADQRGMQLESRILERNDHGLIVRARFTPPSGLPYRRLVVEDETGRKAWSNGI